MYREQLEKLDHGRLAIRPVDSVAKNLTVIMETKESASRQVEGTSEEIMTVTMDEDELDLEESSCEERAGTTSIKINTTAQYTPQMNIIARQKRVELVKLGQRVDFLAPQASRVPLVEAPGQNLQPVR